MDAAVGATYVAADDACAKLEAVEKRI